jgi:hypothetical protein
MQSQFTFFFVFLFVISLPYLRRFLSMFEKTILFHGRIYQDFTVMSFVAKVFAFLTFNVEIKQWRK